MEREALESTSPPWNPLFLNFKLIMIIKSILAFATLVLFSNFMKQDEILVIGHRGAMGHETENTLASVQKALDMGVDMIEIDVFKIKSGEIMVFHDDEVDRLTDGKGNIEDYDFEGLRKLTVQGGHQIPTLQEVLDVIQSKVILNIELKGANTATPVKQIVHEYCSTRGWSLNDFVISSFRWDELKTMRMIDLEMPIAILCGKESFEEAISIGKEINAVAINPNYKRLTVQNVGLMKKEGFKIYPWTVNEPEDIAKMKSFMVDGIITNYPERIH